MKTIEQASMDHIENTMGQFLYKDQSFKAGVEFAQQWISVEDELPEAHIPYRNDCIVSDYVIAKTIDGNWFKLRLIKWTSKGRLFSNWVNSEDYTYFTVTHWRPIELK